MRAIEDMARALEEERAFELCDQVEQYLELLDAAHEHHHARVPRSYFRVLAQIQSRRQSNGVIDQPDTITAAFWALVPPDDR